MITSFILPINSQASGGGDSLDENVVVAEDHEYKPQKQQKPLNNVNQENFNVYQQIEKLAQSQILTKKLETTEL